jgi:thiamine-monophosphate kinase
MKVSELGEDGLIKLLTRDLKQQIRVVCGPGDDCAVVKVGRQLQFLKTDCVVEQVHFLASHDPQAVGWKALCRSLSDIAAMGGVPHDALVSLAVPLDTEVKWLRRLYFGLGRAARKYRVNLVGGETSRSPGPIFISVFLTGAPARPNQYITRAGGRARDLLFVTGRLGGSLSGHHLSFQPRLEEAAWLVRHFQIHAMMDLSDGLAADLPRMAKASELGFRLDYEKIPLNRGASLTQGLQDGEDYELLFAVSPRTASKLVAAWPNKFPRVSLTAIGRFSEHDSQNLPGEGWQHFADR